MTHKELNTILVVNSDLAVLVLMRGVLENDYRVLLAADAESAVRLFGIGVSVDLAVIDHSSGLQPEELERRMKEFAPELRILWMAGFVEDGVVRLKAFDASHQRISESLIQRISIALAAEKTARTAKDVSQAAEASSVATQRVMVAGRV